jgi:hypothetical protein
MKLSIRNGMGHAAMTLAVIAIGCSGIAVAQQAAPAAAGPRKLAPGVVRTVDPARQVEETNSRHDMLGVVAFDADFEWAKGLSFRHDIWSLEFKCKPMRMIWVDVPQQSGRMKRKLIWYLLYSVTNTGQTMRPVDDGNDNFKVEIVKTDIRFVPQFLLRSHETGTVYADRVIPVAVSAIRMREDPARRFYNSAEMLRTIKVGETLWGVATWEDLDPQIDRFSVYVKGLTNAYRWEDDQAAYKKGDPLSGRRLGVKTLKLNFWRPGDEYFEHEGEFRLGIPGQKDYDWVYLY